MLSPDESAAYIKRAFEILREDGGIELLRKLRTFVLLSEPYGRFNRYRLTLRYDAPPRERYRVPPEKIKYDIGNRVQERYGWNTRHPPLRILEGDWDTLKTSFEDKWIYQSYVKRYKKDQPWEQTEYYNQYRDRGQSHEETMERLRKYDRIYKDIKKNGYDEDQPVKVYIGRNGEYMRATGQNRLCMAKVLELDSIPVQVDVVHRQWQRLREEVYNNGLPDGYKELHSHPDLQDILK